MTGHDPVWVLCNHPGCAEGIGVQWCHVAKLQDRPGERPNQATTPWAQESRGHPLPTPQRDRGLWRLGLSVRFAPVFWGR